MPRSFGSVVILVISAAITAPAFGQSVKEVRKVAKQGPSALPELQRFLLNDDVKVRLEAVHCIIEIGGQRGIDPLIEATRDNDPQVQILAVNGLVNFYLPSYVATGMTAPLRKIGSDIRSRFGETEGPSIEPYVVVRPNVVQAVGRVVKNGSSLDARANAARAAGVLRAKGLIPDLVEGLKSRDSDLIWNTLVAFEKMKDSAACPGIRYLIRDFDEKVQVEALEANGVLNCQEARGDIREVLAHSDKERPRRAALSSLAMMPEPNDRASFGTYIENEDDHMRTSAAEGYARLASIDDARKLRGYFDRETRTAPRLALSFALVMDGDIAVTDYAPLRYLVYALNNGNFRESAQIYLSEAARNPEVRRALYAMLSEATRDEKLSLARVFAMSGDKLSVAPLEKLSHDPDSTVAQEGTRQLRNLNARI